MAEKKISELTAKGAAVAATDLMVVSEVSGASYVTKSVTGANITALVTDANLTTTDITTNDVSTSKHGFVPKAPNDATKFLDGTGVFSVPSAGGLTNFTEAENTAAPNATVPVNSLTATGAATNIDVAIVPKGTGGISMAIPDNTSTGGNKRGNSAFDIQKIRATAAQVASGTASFCGGTNNTASGSRAFAFGATNVASGAFNPVAIGNTNTCSGNNSFALGLENTASGNTTVAFGYGNSATGTYSQSYGIFSQSTGINSYAIGYFNTANADYSLALGQRANVFGIIGRQSYASGQEGTSGDAQASKFVLHERTTNDTATTITTNSSAASTNNQVILSNNSAYRFKGSIVGKQSGSTNAAVWDIDGFLVRGANAAATTLNVSNVTLVENTPAWGTPTLAADVTNGGLQVQVIGAAATNIQWTAVIETTEVIYA